MCKVESEQIFGLTTSVGIFSSISPSLAMAFTNFGFTITPLLAMAL